MNNRTIKIIDRRVGQIHEYNAVTPAMYGTLSALWQFFDDEVEVWVSCEDYPEEFYRAH